MSNDQPAIDRQAQDEQPGDQRSDKQRSLLARIDAFLDATPRGSADPVDIGPMRAFLSRASWPYYARPRPEVDLTGPAAVTAEHLEAAAATLTDSGAPVSFEWVHEQVPSFVDAAAEGGYDVTLHPLLVLDELIDVRSPTGVSIRFLTADDLAVPAARVVADLSFAFGGTGTAPLGVAERDVVLAERATYADDHFRGRLANGMNVTAIAETAEGVVGSGGHQPVHGVSEIVGVAVLPSHRRQGIGAAITAALARDAQDKGTDVVMLSAGSDDVARVYERIGFVRVGHAGEAEPHTNPNDPAEN